MLYGTIKVERITYFPRVQAERLAEALNAEESGDPYAWRYVVEDAEARPGKARIAIYDENDEHVGYL